MDTIHVKTQTLIYTIIYGFDDNIINLIKSYNQNPYKILIIEPRKNILDNIYQKLHSLNITNYSIIKKCLTKNIKGQSFIYQNQDSFTIHDSLEQINQIFNLKKEQVFLHSINEIIADYNIKKIDSFIINFDISNIAAIVDSISNIDYIISNIYIKDNLYDKYFSFTNSLLNFTNIKANSENECENEIKFVQLSNKNKDIALPKICMYLIDNANSSETINFVDNNNIEIVSIENEKSIKSKKSKIIMHEWVTHVLKKFFEYEKNVDDKHENFIIFNSDYFKINKKFDLFYKLDLDTFYVNRNFDIIYGSKNTFFILYEFLQSEHFKNLIEMEKNKRKGTFYIFAKNIFYDYLLKNFKVKNI